MKRGTLEKAAMEVVGTVGAIPSHVSRAVFTDSLDITSCFCKNDRTTSDLQVN
jgi:hypothetical protein